MGASTFRDSTASGARLGSAVRAPLDEWDGTVLRKDANPPTGYEWDHDAGRWRPHW